jgi:ElaB/YqjD/DUF883 family membrane-anchored ribosome-binding protein
MECCHTFHRPTLNWVAVTNTPLSGALEMNLANLAASMKTMLQNAASDENRQKAAEALGKAREQAGQVAERVKQATDTAAEATAKKVTEWTGRETTSGEVKKAALVAGVAVAVVGAAACLGAASGSTGGRRRAGGGSGYGHWGNDFESQVGGCFAENGGSLNWVTPHVDSEGQVYSY